eukprot:4461095-Amphidinium_carterae.1
MRGNRIAIGVLEGEDVLEGVLGGVGEVALVALDVGAEDDVLGCGGVPVDVDVVGPDVRSRVSFPFCV